jgi:dihydrofolate synthase/folylpolyglutamate synthase
MDARAWLAHLETFGIKLGLDSITAIAAALGNPHRGCPVLHIAGTNGKGSVSAMVSQALTAAGYRTGRYTSPHLVHLEERFAIDGRPVAGGLLDAALDEVHQAVARLRSAGRLAVEPTYFEATTAAAFLLFRQAGIDVAVIEVGLGGRFDATNIVVPAATCITSIALDHEAQLGGTLASIAAEKAGTIKPGTPVVVGPLPDDALDVVARAAKASGAPLVRACDGASVHAVTGADGITIELTTPVARYGPLRLTLAGRHQVDNALVAVRLLETAAAAGLPISRDAIARGLAEARWPARLQRIETPRGDAIVDGAHNPAGAAALASYLAAHFPGGVPMVVGMMADKDAAGMLSPLAAAARPLVLTRAPGPRGADPAQLAGALDAAGRAHVVVEPDLDRALAYAWRAGPVIVVAGSLYLAGAVLALLDVPVE